MKAKVPVLICLLVILTLTAAGITQAQRPGGRPTPSGGQRPDLQITPAATLGSVILPTAPDLSGLQATLTALSPAFDGTLSIPVTIPPMNSSEEAEAVITDFASVHLGLALDLLYAGQYGGGRLATQSSDDALDAVLAQLPAEVQQYLAALQNLSGDAYWGVFASGVGAAGLGDCTGPNCSIDMDNLDFYITNVSGGLYALYTAAAPASAADALNLVLAVYPGLADAGLQQITTEAGYAFEAVGLSGSSATSSLYYAGTISSGGQTLVYALIAVGQGYVDLMR